MPLIPVDQKFHTVPAEVDTQDRGSARANADREIYTMQDIIDSVGGGGGATIGEKLDFTVRDAAYSAVGDHEGIDLKIANTSVTAGLVYELGENPGVGPEWFESDASIITLSQGLLAVATDTGSGVNMMQKGLVVLSGFGAAKNGSVLYLSATTPGTLTTIPPTGMGEIVRIAGYLVDQTLDLVYFDPSQDWIEIA